MDVADAPKDGDGKDGESPDSTVSTLEARSELLYASCYSVNINVKTDVTC
jgi:hypothetical protein